MFCVASLVFSRTHFPCLPVFQNLVNITLPTLKYCTINPTRYCFCSSGVSHLYSLSPLMHSGGVTSPHWAAGGTEAGPKTLWTSWETTCDPSGTFKRKTSLKTPSPTSSSACRNSLFQYKSNQKVRLLLISLSPQLNTPHCVIV